MWTPIAPGGPGSPADLVTMVSHRPLPLGALGALGLPVAQGAPTATGGPGGPGYLVVLVTHRPPLPLGALGALEALGGPWGSPWHRKHPLPLRALEALGTW